MSQRIVATEDLEALRARVREIETALRDADAEESRLTDELAKVDAQAGYYDSLAGEMKRDLQPPNLATLIRSLRW